MNGMAAAQSQALTMSKFAALGFTRAEAFDWLAAGFSTHTATGWRSAGFAPSEAAAWRSAATDRCDPIIPDEARSAADRGETPETYRSKRNATYPKPQRTR